MKNTNTQPTDCAAWWYTSFRLPIEFRAPLRDLAAREFSQVNGIVCKAIREYIERNYDHAKADSATSRP